MFNVYCTQTGLLFYFKALTLSLRAIIKFNNQGIVFYLHFNNVKCTMSNVQFTKGNPILLRRKVILRITLHVRDFGGKYHQLLTLIS